MQVELEHIKSKFDVKTPSYVESNRAEWFNLTTSLTMDLAIGLIVINLICVIRAFRRFGRAIARLSQLHKSDSGQSGKETNTTFVIA